MRAAVGYAPLAVPEDMHVKLVQMARTARKALED